MLEVPGGSLVLGQDNLLYPDQMLHTSIETKFGNEAYQENRARCLFGTVTERLGCRFNARGGLIGDTNLFEEEIVQARKNLVGGEVFVKTGHIGVERTMLRQTAVSLGSTLAGRSRCLFSCGRERAAGRTAMPLIKASTVVDLGGGHCFKVPRALGDRHGRGCAARWPPPVELPARVGGPGPVVALAVEQCLHGARPTRLVAPLDVPYRVGCRVGAARGRNVPAVMPAMTLVPLDPPVHIDWILAICDRCITHSELSISMESLIVLMASAAPGPPEPPSEVKRQAPPAPRLGSRRRG